MANEYFAPNEGTRNRLGRLLYGAITQSILETSVSVGNVSAVKLPTTPLSGRNFLLIENLSANMLYVGSSTVSTSNGIQILPKGSIQLNIQDNVDLYGIADGAGADIRVLEGS